MMLLDDHKMLWDPSALDILDIETDDVLRGGEIVAAFQKIHPEDRARTTSKFFDCAETGKPYIHSYRVIGRKGRERKVFAFGQRLGSVFFGIVMLIGVGEARSYRNPLSSSDLCDSRQLLITMADMSRWMVPVATIAMHRAHNFAYRFDGDVEHSLAMDTQPFFQNKDEVEDWAALEMNWPDVSLDAVRISDPSPDNMQRSWLDSLKEVLDDEQFYESLTSKLR